MLEFFTHPLFTYVILTSVTGISFLLVGFYLATPRHDEVEYLDPAAHTGFRFTVREKLYPVVFTHRLSSKLPPMSFIEGATHHGVPYLIETKGRLRNVRKNVSLARVGTAFMRTISDAGQEVKVSLSDAVKSKVGKDRWEKMSLDLKKAFDDDRVGIIVDLKDESLAPSGFKAISEDDTMRVSDELMIRAKAKAMETKGTTNWVNIMFAGGAEGLVVMMILLFTGHIQ